MGEVEPYHGVKPERVYLRRNPDEEAGAEFFRTGEETGRRYAANHP
jgi:hypothetical protein